MELKCSVLVETGTQNRHSKPALACLALGREKQNKKDNGAPLLLFKTQSINCPKFLNIFRLKSIIKTLIKSGKSTLQFTNPDVYVFISKADPVKLHKFITNIEAFTSKENSPSLIADLQIMANFQSKSHPLKAQVSTKLEVVSRAKYPNSFPKSLEVLILSEIGLKTIDARWFRLKFLRCLDLSNNKLGKIRSELEWQRLYQIEYLDNLQELSLHSNDFNGFTEKFYDCLPPSLTSLDLSHNKLEFLSERISRLKSLIVLKINNNYLQRLPQDLCLLPKLLDIYSSHNRISFLPGTVFNYRNFNRFRKLDFSGQQQGADINNLRSSIKLPSLVDLSAAAVFNNPHLSSDGSTLCKNVEDFLPRILYENLRNHLIRCENCLILYNNILQSTFFRNIDIAKFASHYYFDQNKNYLSLVRLCVTCGRISKSKKRKMNQNFAPLNNI